VTPEQFADLLALGHETPGVEFKGPFDRTDKPSFAKVVKAVLAMANRRDGGRVIVGVDEVADGAGFSLRPTGLTEAQVRSWGHDDVAEQLGKFADPFVTFSTRSVRHDGRMFVLLDVGEFEEVPVLCRHPFDGVLRQGACYVRRRSRIETSEIPTHVEMRELLDLATEKGIRRFLSRFHRAGIDIAGLRQVPDDAARFDAQRGDFR
jgi:predicted HTH transcriptional regulator